MAGPPVPAAGAPPAPLSRRQAQARRNDELILAAAREVFLRDPRAPISAVAETARVGISALYRRYPSKDDLLQTLYAEGLRRHAELAERALDPGLDPWEAFAGFVTGMVQSDVHALSAHLFGRLTPNEELHELAARAGALTEQLMERTRGAEAVRADVGVRDLPMLFEQLSAVRVQDAVRTEALRLRYVALVLDALRPEAATAALPGLPPTEAELAERRVTD